MSKKGLMSAPEQIEMMRRVSSEIKALRSEIDRLAPKADAYEKLSQVLALLPRPSQGYGEDVAWTLDKRIAEIEAEIAQNAATNTPETAANDIPE